MNIKLKPEAGYWVIAGLYYCFPNLVAFIGLESGLFQQDISDYISLGLLTRIACLLSIFLMFGLLVFCCNGGAKRFSTNETTNPNWLLGFLILVLQSLGLIALLLYDYGRVGGARESQQFIPRLISYLNPDALFMLYYAHCRPKRVPYLNTAIYISSSALRGWSGFIIVLFFIEIYFVLKRRGFKRTLLVVLCLILALFSIFPWIYAFRETVRGSIVEEKETYLEAGNTLLSRLQHLSVIEIAAQDAPRISLLLQGGGIKPFYADSKIGLRLFPWTVDVISLQQYLALRSSLSGQSEDNPIIDETQMWFTDTGLGGWLFVLNWYTVPLYLIFVCAILIFPYWVTSRYIHGYSIVPSLHCASIFYVAHGWFGPQILFCIGSILYIVLYRASCVFSIESNPEKLKGKDLQSARESLPLLRGTVPRA